MDSDHYKKQLKAILMFTPLYYGLLSLFSIEKLQREEVGTFSFSCHISHRIYELTQETNFISIELICLGFRPLYYQP